jgi:protease I
MTATPLSGAKVLLVLAPKGYREVELKVCRTALEAAGATVLLGTPEGGEATGAAGDETVETIPLTEPRTSELHGAVVLGGPGAQAHLWTNGLLHKVLRMLERDGRPLGAVGLGVVALGKAGLLEKKKATVFMTPDTLKALKDAGAHYERRPVVIDGNLVTCDGAEPVERFATLFRDLVQQKREPGRR